MALSPQAEKYALTHGSTANAIRAFVTDLMRADKVSFKRGYSYENAVIAAAEAFGISEDAVRVHAR